jgi:hypothetical protein
MGPIVDRENEHLGTSDVAVIAARRSQIQMAKNLAAGKEPKIPPIPAWFGVRAIDAAARDEELNAVVKAYGEALRLPKV